MADEQVADKPTAAPVPPAAVAAAPSAPEPEDKAPAPRVETWKIAQAVHGSAGSVAFNYAAGEHQVSDPDQQEVLRSVLGVAPHGGDALATLMSDGTA